MLMLRRRVGEKIYVFDNRTEVVIEVVDLDLDSGAVHLRLNEGDPIEVFPPEEIRILQGDGVLKIMPITELDPETASFTKIGVTVPRDMNILRGELVRGMSREDRAKIVRAA